MNKPITANPVDQEWSTILFEMNRGLKNMCLSLTEQKFLDNVVILEDLKDIVEGCEELEIYKGIMASQENEEGLWEKIKKFFVDLWNKFVNWIKNIPNWIRPYINRIIDMKARIGVTVTMTPAPQNFIGVDYDELLNYYEALKKIKVIRTQEGTPLMVFENGQTVKDNFNPIKFKNIQIANDAELIKLIDLVVTYYHSWDNVTALLENQKEVIVKDLNESIDAGLSTVDKAKVFQDWQNDIKKICDAQKQLIELAKNISNIKTKTITH